MIDAMRQSRAQVAADPRYGVRLDFTPYDEAFLSAEFSLSVDILAATGPTGVSLANLRFHPGKPGLAVGNEFKERT
jgi:hypothetical protein